MHKLTTGKDPNQKHIYLLRKKIYHFVYNKVCSMINRLDQVYPIIMGSGMGNIACPITIWVKYGSSINRLN